MSDKIPLKIPVSVVPRAAVDYAEEILNFLGSPLRIDDRLELLPPSPAILSMLELADCKMYSEPQTATNGDLWRCVYILAHRRAALPAVTAAHRCSDWRYVESEGAEIVRKHPAIMERLDDIWRLLREWAETGHAMLPPGPPETFSRPWIFDGPFLAVCVHAAGHCGIDADTTLWTLPMTAIGHLIAISARCAGEKHVERPPDREALERITAEAEERERKGELHPWQKVDPMGYPLSATQIAARFEVVEEYNECLRKQREGLTAHG